MVSATAKPRVISIYAIENDSDTESLVRNSWKGLRAASESIRMAEFRTSLKLPRQLKLRAVVPASEVDPETQFVDYPAIFLFCFNKIDR